MNHLLIVMLLTSNATGKTVIRPTPGAMVRTPALSGPLILDDSGTVCHAYWDGTQIRDMRGCGWSMQGTVPQIVRSGRTPAGSGPYSGSNNYTASAGAMDFASDFSVCVVFGLGASQPADYTVLVNDGGTNDGYILQFDGTGASGKIQFVTGPQIVASTNASVLNGINVICAGRALSITKGYVKLNLGSFITGNGVLSAGSNRSIYLGVYRTGAVPFPGKIYEVWFSTTTPSDALFTAIQQRVKTRAGITAW